MAATREKVEKSERDQKFRTDMQKRQADAADSALRSKKFLEQTTNYLEASGICSPGASPMMIRSSASPRSSSTPSTRRAPGQMSNQQAGEQQRDEEGDGFAEPAPLRAPK